MGIFWADAPLVGTGFAVLQELNQQDNISRKGQKNPQIEGALFPDIVKTPDANSQCGYQNRQRPEQDNGTVTAKQRYQDAADNGVKEDYPPVFASAGTTAEVCVLGEKFQDSFYRPYGRCRLTGMGVVAGGIYGSGCSSTFAPQEVQNLALSGRIFPHLLQNIWLLQSEISP